MEPSILKAPLFFSKPERESIDHGNIYENKTLLAPGCACGLTVLNAIDVYPKIFPADTTAKIQVEGLNPEWLNHSGLSIGYVRDGGTYLNGAQAEWNGWEPVSTFEVEDQILTLTYPLNGEHEHTFRVTVSDTHTYEPGTYFWWYYTIVFAKSAELEDLAEAFRANRSCWQLKTWNNVFPVTMEIFV